MKKTLINLSLVLSLVASGLVGCAYKSGSPGRGVPSAVTDQKLELPANIKSVRALEQHWSDDVARTFYNTPQGSHLLPLVWFVNLEQDASTKRFLDPDNIRALGYLPRSPDKGNELGLPVGFVKDDSYLGLTCAACHTGLIYHKDTAWLIDGGPTLGDGEMLMRKLESALKETSNDPAKFDRFAINVLRGQDSPAKRKELKTALVETTRKRSEYNARNLPGPNQPRFGPGRIDAFGGILNEVAVRFAQSPNNETRVDAPVSYPFLWDTPHHDVVQWNGLTANSKCDLARLVPSIKTDEYGALGRNVGEVVGVFADVNTTNNPDWWGGYPSSVNKANLIELENMLRNLWSPLWPQDAFGQHKPELVAKGKELHEKNCVQCHQHIKRDDERRQVTAVMKDVGTDPTMAANVATRTANTGILKDRITLGVPPVVLDEREPLVKILTHIGQRVVFGDRIFDTNADIPIVFSVKATVQLEGGELAGSFSELKFANGVLQEAKAASNAVQLVVKGERVALGKPRDVTRMPASLVKQFSPQPTTTDKPTLEAWKVYGKISNQKIRLHNLDLEKSNITTQLMNAHRTFETNRLRLLESPRSRDFINMRDATALEQTQLSNELSTIQFNQAAIAKEVAILETNNIDSKPTSWVLDFTNKAIERSAVSYHYKGRPLNGIWATAPYLHNGSVPNLDELLKEASARTRKFRVGSRELDVEHVGFRTDVGDYEFDTTASPGNSNVGHDHASGTYTKEFSAEEREELIEYLKSL